ncbi:hypothetical protein Taro_025232 [Colocasia esculenta]|uniref:Uncharacterized protein n=1 Tax=Colocasia esculenta TaxID=4460 RepID=A0A843VG04_COLES|nr:hypothetical protein [Colocasia esculenta]
MAEAARWQAKAGPYLGEISALAFLRLPNRLSSSFPILLSGTGSQVLAYDLEYRRLLCSFHAFRGVRVHGLALRGGSVSYPEELVAVYGERRVKLLRVMVGGDGRAVSVGMEVLCWLPRFDHWVLDAMFVEGGRCLVVGLSDNSVAVWDVVCSKLLFRVNSPERCLLYSMRLWGEDVKTLCVASGTIFNEILVWKLVSQTHHPEEHFSSLNQSCCNNTLLSEQQYMATHLSTLTGHNGSIFRIAWSFDGSKLLSASDDRSARIWLVNNTKKQDDGIESMLPGDRVLNILELFGHDARIWDGYVSDSVVITAGEDCTCRVWDMDGNQIMMVKEHSGRGIWRCLYDPKTSLLITAGFDSAIQVHLIPALLCKNSPQSEGMLNDLDHKTEIFSIGIPSASEKIGLTDSKSEYVRCLRFRQEDSLYVATNNGYLYHVKLSNPGDVRWTQLVRISDEVPIICMDLIPMNLTDSSVDGDKIALGDGKGNATVLRVVDLCFHC